jgi:hypothetical protein
LAPSTNPNRGSSDFRPETTTSLADVFLRALQSVAGVAAVTIGLLYLIGIGIKTRELQHADLSVRDVLPLFPLELILRASLVIVWPALAALIVLIILMAGGRLYESWLSRLSVQFVRNELTREPGDAELLDIEKKVRARSDWATATKRVKRAINEAEKSGDGEERLAQLKTLRWAFRGWTIIGAVVLFLILPTVYGFLPPRIALGCLIAYYIVLAVIVRHPGPVEREFFALYFVFIVGAVVFAIMYPRPLAEVTIQPSGQVGDLVVVSDATWYVATGDGRIVAIPADQVDCAEIDPQDRKETVWQSIWQGLFEADDDAQTAPRLECDASGLVSAP